ncbi:MAG: exodeoxyribonuclease VII small subunit [Planctomycetes bacterium]|nr:exodeoxyribonuclease VII small subunit [Planctomycetota bacterium]
MATKSKDDEPRAPKASFDERLAALDQLVVEIEGGKLGLEASMQRYQDGMRLYQELKAEIEAHRQRFQELAADGSLVPAKDAGRDA